jgi:hypothetical protein
MIYLPVLGMRSWEFSKHLSDGVEVTSNGFGTGIGVEIGDGTVLKLVLD